MPAFFSPNLRSVEPPQVLADCSFMVSSIHACMCVLSRVRLFMTPGTVAHQAFLSTGFSRQEYWSGLPFPSPGDLPNPGIKPTSPALAGRFLTPVPPAKPLVLLSRYLPVSCRFLKSYLLQWLLQGFPVSSSCPLSITSAVN